MRRGRVRSRAIFTYSIDKIANSSFYRAIGWKLGDINNEIAEGYFRPCVVINYGKVLTVMKSDLYEGACKFCYYLNVLNNTQLIFVLPEDLRIRRLVKSLYEGSTGTY